MGTKIFLYSGAIRIPKGDCWPSQVPKAAANTLRWGRLSALDGTIHRPLTINVVPCRRACAVRWADRAPPLLVLWGLKRNGRSRQMLLSFFFLIGYDLIEPITTIPDFEFLANHAERARALVASPGFCSPSSILRKSNHQTTAHQLIQGSQARKARSLLTTRRSTNLGFPT